jgi:hypothetical protein
MTVGQQCGLKANEFAVVEESVLLDGAELLDREANICQVLDPFTKLYVGVTVVLPRDLPSQQESRLRKPIIAAGGSCYVRSASESFDQVVELARDRMRRLHLAGGDKVDAGVAAVDKTRHSADDLKSFTYTTEEQAALRKAYESDEQDGSIIS